MILKKVIEVEELAQQEFNFIDRIIKLILNKHIKGCSQEDYILTLNEVLNKQKLLEERITKLENSLQNTDSNLQCLSNNLQIISEGLKGVYNVLQQLVHLSSKF